jgi:hypothetical protein
MLKYIVAHFEGEVGAGTAVTCDGIGRFLSLFYNKIIWYFFEYIILKTTSKTPISHIVIKLEGIGPQLLGTCMV